MYLIRLWIENFNFKIHQFGKLPSEKYKDAHSLCPLASSRPKLTQGMTDSYTTHGN